MTSPNKPKDTVDYSLSSKRKMKDILERTKKILGFKPEASIKEVEAHPDFKKIMRNMMMETQWSEPTEDQIVNFLYDVGEQLGETRERIKEDTEE